MLVQLLQVQKVLLKVMLLQEKKILMGLVMKEARGKIDGKTVIETLRLELKKAG